METDVSVSARGNKREKGKVGLPGVEPGTSRLSGARSNRLSYKPAKRRDAREKTVLFSFLNKHY